MQKLSLGSSDLAELAAEVFDRGGGISFVALGSSMLPTLRDGDLLAAVPQDPFSIKKGVLLMYRTGEDRAAVHRVADAGRISSHGEILLSSDSSPQDRYRISIEQVMGRIVSATRDGKTVTIDSTVLDEPGTVYARTITRLGSVSRSAVIRIFSLVSSFRLYRKLFSTLLRPFVKYEIHPAAQDSRKPGASSTWDWLHAYLFGRTIGSAQLIRFNPGTPFGDYPWLFSMRVRSLFRGGGIGKGLTSLAVSIAELSGDKMIGLMVKETNRQAVNLYRSMGFELVPSTDLSSGLREKADQGKTVMLRKQSH